MQLPYVLLEGASIFRRAFFLTTNCRSPLLISHVASHRIGTEELLKSSAAVVMPLMRSTTRAMTPPTP